MRVLSFVAEILSRKQGLTFFLVRKNINYLIEIESNWLYKHICGSECKVNSQEKEADRKRSEHAAKTAYMLCRTSRRVLTLFCQSLTLLHRFHNEEELKNRTQIANNPKI
jgi:1-aminocyclopropane-1-carboxylate deaminase/D-cysteine desulfhydrase-like pyridoxal-dependent ACC family enzyme